MTAEKQERLAVAERFSSAEAAAQLGVNARTVQRIARAHGIGTNWGGQHGWSFTARDVAAIEETQRKATHQAAAPQADPRGRRRGVHQ